MPQKEFSIEERHVHQMEREKFWVSKRMAHDEFYKSLPRVRRDYAFLGRIFVLWEHQAGAPLIRALVRISDISLTPQRGMSVSIDISRPTPHGFTQMMVDHRPRRLEDLPVYFWLPAYVDLRYTPANPEDPFGARTLSIPLMTRISGHPEKDAGQEGILFIESTSEFSKRWPKHAI